MLAEASQSARRHDFVHRVPDIAAAQVLVLLHQGKLAAAAELAQAHQLPTSQARVHLAHGNTSAALAVLKPWRAQVEAREWADERLKVLVLQALAFQAQGERERAVNLLLDAVTLAEPGGFIRTFLDEGTPMLHLLAMAEASGKMRDSCGRLLAAFVTEKQKGRDAALPAPAVQPLTPREMEVLQLMAQGLSNQEIAERLVLALDTVKGHNQSIFGKLQAQRRTEAVARARALRLL
jgi:LuxR family maltose regulon positive regulatory protein